MWDDTSLWDVTKPSSARCYDYLLGGKDNFECDREAVDMLLQVAPDTVHAAVANRAFACRASQFMGAQGIRQFIDLGSGIPTGDCMVREEYPEARVLYVDNDPIVVSHSNALRAIGDGVACVLGDIRDPESVLSHPKVVDLIDFDEPVAVACFAVLDAVQDKYDPWEIVATLREKMAPGSYLGLSHSSRRSDPEVLRQTELIHRRIGGVPLTFRHDQDVLAMFDGFELLEPGLVDVNLWRPDETKPETKLTMVGGVARKV